MWNYRIIRHKVEDEEDWLAIHEVFYNDNDNPNGCTQKSIDVSGEDCDSIKWQLTKMKEALDKPILDYQMFLDMEKEDE